MTDVSSGLGRPSICGVDAGELIGEPSTVVDVTAIDGGGGWEILRAKMLGL